MSREAVLFLTRNFAKEILVQEGECLWPSGKFVITIPKPKAV